jgi:hypothetical protein
VRVLVGVAGRGRRFGSAVVGGVEAALLLGIAARQAPSAVVFVCAAEFVALGGIVA